MSTLTRNHSELKVLVTRRFPGPIRQILGQFDLTYIDKDQNLPRQKLRSLIKDKHAILCSIPDKIDRDVLANAENLRVVSTYSVGYDHIDVEEATKRGIAVTNTPNVLTDATADLTFALLLGIARRIIEGHNLVTQRRWKDSWSPYFMVGTDLVGKTLGILGMGRIGKAVAARAMGFGLKVAYYNRHRLSQKEEQTLRIDYLPLDGLLNQADFVLIHVPLTEETHHLIDAKKIVMMKKTAFLINTSRGPIVDEDALIDALEKKQIAGAALDVYGEEPLPTTSRLLSLNNVLLTPHIGSAAEDARYKMGEIAAQNLADALLGKKPLYNVNVRYAKYVKR